MSARCATAFFGSYAAASATAALIARLAPVTPVEATGWAMITSFLTFAGLGLWAFHEPQLSRVAMIIWGGFAVSAAIVVVLGPRS